MSPALALRHLWLRPQTLFVFLSFGGLCSIIARLAYVTHGGLDHFVGAEAEAVLNSLQLRAAVTAVALAATAAASFGFGLFDAQLALNAALLPKFALRARWLCATVSASIGVAAAGVSLAIDRHTPPAAAFAVGLLVAVGVLWAIDPRRRRLHVFGVFGVWLAPLAAPALFEFASTAPTWGAAVSVGAALAALAVQWSRRAVIERATDPRCVSLTRAARAEIAGGSALPDSVVARREFHAHSADPLTHGVRAALHEQTGMIRGGIVTQSLLLVALLLTALLVTTALDAWRGGQGNPAGLGNLLALLEGRPSEPGTGSLHTPSNWVLLPIWCATYSVLIPVGLEFLCDYPIARATRAEVAWRVSGLRLFLLAAGVALGLVGLALGARVLLETPVPSNAPPIALLNVAAVAALAPLGFGLRLRFLSRRGGPPALLRMSLLASAVALVMCASTAALREWLVQRPQDLPWAIAACGVALVASQLLWRAFLHRQFRTRDL